MIGNPLKRTAYGYLPYLMIVVGIIGAIASFALTYDKLQVLKDPNYVPSCNINPIFSCGSVMTTEQASFLGVPNTIFGLAAFSMLLTFGALLVGGAKVKRWVWLVAQTAATAGLLAMHYLFFQSAYRINAICIWCLTVWIVTIPLFWYLTVYNLKSGNIRLPKALKGAGEFATKHPGEILVVWYGVLALILLKEFWYYWSTLL